MKKYLSIIFIFCVPLLTSAQSLMLDMNGHYFDFRRNSESTFFPDSFLAFESLLPDSASDTSRTGALYSSGDYAYTFLKMYYYPAGKLNWGFEMENEGYEGYSTYDRFFVHLALQSAAGNHFFYTENHSEYIFRGLMSHPLYPTSQVTGKRTGAVLRHHFNTLALFYAQYNHSFSGMDAGNTDNQDYVRVVSDTLSDGKWFLAGSYDQFAYWQDTLSEVVDRIRLSGGLPLFSAGIDLINSTPEWTFRSVLQFGKMQLELGRMTDIIPLRTRQIGGLRDIYYSSYYGRIQINYVADHTQLRALGSLKWLPDHTPELFYSLIGDSLLSQTGSSAIQYQMNVVLHHSFNYFDLDQSLGLTIFNGYHLQTYYPGLFEWRSGIRGNLRMFENHLLLRPMLENHVLLQANYKDIWFSPELLRYLPIYETGGQLQWIDWLNAGIYGRISNFELDFHMENLFQQTIYSTVNQAANGRFYRLVIHWNWKN